VNETVAYAMIGLVSVAAMLIFASGPLAEAAERVDDRLTAAGEWSLAGALSNCASAVIGGGACEARVFTPVELVVEVRGNQILVWDNESLTHFAVELPVEVRLLNGEVYPWHPGSPVSVVRGLVWIEASWDDGAVALRVSG